MNTLALDGTPRGGWPRRLVQEVFARERRLALFGAVLLVAMLPTLLALGLDDRTLRGVNVWLKPLKFMASVALFAWTTAWFVGLLPAALRQGRAVSAIAWVLIGAGSFEIVYITLQAGLGQASHYHVADAFHGTMYTLMGLGALAMTATQAVLAVLLHRHGPSGLLARSVVVGLAATFVLGSVAGFMLGGLQPPSGAGLPLVGWHGAGDLRPAHFVGLHAHQLLPLAGWCIARAGGGMRTLAAVTVVYALAWSALMVIGLPR